MKRSGEDSAMDIRSGEPFTHLVRAGLLVAHGGDSEVITEVVVAVAVVGRLNDFNEVLVLVLEAV